MSERHLLRDVDVGGGRLDVRLAGGLISDIGVDLRPVTGENVIDGRGGALIPGLADHHLHLAATAAAQTSVDARDLTRPDLAAAIAASEADIVRVVGWHESEPLGALTARVLDEVAPGRSVRVQHRSGSVWVLSSALLARLPATGHPGLERDAAGAATGRLFQGDRWLGEQLGTGAPDFSALATTLGGYGITHLTDATPGHDPALAEHIRAQLPQHVSFMGITPGSPRKLLLPEHDLPDLATLIAEIRAAHESGRPVAVHSVTRASLLLTLAAFDDAGRVPGDRIEHAAVVPFEARNALTHFTVVTQPAIASTRGDAHRAAEEADDHDNLWPVASLLDAGVRVGLSSDAPHGPLNPWQVMRSARDRVMPSGRIANGRERITAERALAAMTTHLDDPGGAPREIAPDVAADLVLCHVPRAEVLRMLDSEVVRAVFIGGEPVTGLG